MHSMLSPSSLQPAAVLTPRGRAPLRLAVSLACLIAVGGCATGGSGDVVTRFGDAATVYATGTQITAGAPLFFSSGATAGPNAPTTMKGQALATMQRLEKNLTDAGFKRSDVAFVRAYLVAGPDGKVDFAGWNEAWAETFGNATMPTKPSRTTIAVPQLGSPTTLIEIEYVASAKAAPAVFASASAAASNPMLKPFYGASTSRISGGGVGVEAGAGLYWTAGIPGDSKLLDMKAQSRDILTKLQANLAAVGLSFKDAVFLRAFVGPGKDGKYDTAGWNAAYDEFFNNPANPHKPARTTVTTPTYGGSGTQMEIEILAAFPAAPAADKVAFPAMSGASANANLKAYGPATSPISGGIALKPGSSLYFASGAVSTAGGDVKTQAIEALTTLQKRMAEAGVSFKDVTFLRAYVVPGEDGKIDFPGWSAAYGQFFNNPAQPNKPARTTIAVTALPRPDMKIEIDVIAAKP